jgi:hypothetical protein
MVGFAALYPPYATDIAAASLKAARRYASLLTDDDELDAAFCLVTGIE